MRFSVKKISGGVLYKDEEIVCIKRDSKYLDVYQLSPSFKTILTVELSRRTNKIGRYEHGIYYFQDQSTIFHSFMAGVEKKVEGRFYYKVNPRCVAYTTAENKNKIYIEFDGLVEVPVLTQGGQKLFLDYGVVQEHTGYNKAGSIVYNSFLTGEHWKQDYSALTESDNAILHSQIICLAGKLFFVIDGNDNRGLFVLELSTGQILRKFEGLCYEIFTMKIISTLRDLKISSVGSTQIVWRLMSGTVIG